MWFSGELRIGKVGGIAISVHPTFALVLIWAAWQGLIQYGNLAGAGYSVLSIGLLFACVLLHELGHGIQAHALGLPVRGITLLPFGGLIQLETNPSHPWQELLVALAGPLVNLGLAMTIWIVVALIQPLGIRGWSDYILFRATPGVNTLLLYLMWANVILFLFNMLPAFPMDGGRVMRGALAILSNYETGTRIAAWLGRILAVGLVIIGLFGWPPSGVVINPLLLVVAAVVYLGAHQEDLYVRRRRALVRVEVGDVCHTVSEALAPWDPVTRTLARRLKGNRALPVMVGERLVGLVTAYDMRRPLGKVNSLTVAHIMRSDFPLLRPHDTLWVALQEMSANQLATLPVVQGNAFCGLVSLDDVRNAWRFSARHRRRTEPTPVSGDVTR